MMQGGIRSGCCKLMEELHTIIDQKITWQLF
jgi:hypothetical protein